MTGKTWNGPTFYYDRKKRVELVLDDSRVAILPPPAKADRLKEVGEQLLFGIVLTERTAMRVLFTDTELQTLDEAAALLPVFVFGGTTLVCLPEIIVSARSKQQERVLVMCREQVEVKSRDSDRLVIFPKSGRADEAMTLANSLAEQFPTIAVAPNFLRLKTSPM